MGAKLVRNTFTVTGSGTQAVCIQLRPGDVLVSAAAHNGDKPFNRVKLYLTDLTRQQQSGGASSGIGSQDCLPLNDDIQGGMNDQVVWHGRITIDETMNILVAAYWNTSTGNLLLIEGAVE